MKKQFTAIILCAAMLIAMCPAALADIDFEWWKNPTSSSYTGGYTSGLDFDWWKNDIPSQSQNNSNSNIDFNWWEDDAPQATQPPQSSSDIDVDLYTGAPAASSSACATCDGIGYVAVPVSGTNEYVSVACPVCGGNSSETPAATAAPVYETATAEPVYEAPAASSFESEVEGFMDFYRSECEYYGYPVALTVRDTEFEESFAAIGVAAVCFTDAGNTRYCHFFATSDGALLTAIDMYTASATADDLDALIKTAMIFTNCAAGIDQTFVNWCYDSINGLIENGSAGDSLTYDAFDGIYVEIARYQNGYGVYIAAK